MPAAQTGGITGFTHRFVLFYAALKTAMCALGGRRAGLLAFALGAVMTLALPPLNFFPALAVGLTGGFWLLCGARNLWGAFGRGLAFGFGYFIVGLYWIGFAFLVDAARFAWMAPFAVAGLSLFLALYPALTFAVFHRLRRDRPGVPDNSGVVLFTGLWVLGEWLRGWVLTGFPWNPLGEAFDASPALLQTASITGVYGLSVLAVLAGTAPAVLGPGRRAGTRFVLVAAALVAAVWGAGMMRLGGAADATVPGVQLRLVQPNISQKDKWRPELRQAHVIKQIALSTAPAAAGDPAPTLVIWGETAVPFYLAADPARRALVAAAVPRAGAGAPSNRKGLLITGAPRAERIASPAPGGPRVRVWNSAHALNGQGEIVATYDKAHLVPFGEYVPLRGFLSRFMDVRKITAGSVDFSAGPGPRAVGLPGLPAVSPLICYEAIFPGAVATRGAERPGWLLNLTNDSWYGRTAGPYQHLAQTRMRAVEEGLPLVRVAGTGISAVVDGYGRVTGSLGLGVEGVLDRPLPQALPPTVFARLGNVPALVLVLLLIVFGVAWRRPPPDGGKI